MSAVFGDGCLEGCARLARFGTVSGYSSDELENTDCLVSLFFSRLYIFSPLPCHGDLSASRPPT
jgi:hypothetical protein